MCDLALISEPDRSSLMVYHVYPVSQYDSSIRSRNVTNMPSLASPQINIAEIFPSLITAVEILQHTPYDAGCALCYLGDVTC